jgi:PAS domain S-box-containing protein
MASKARGAPPNASQAEHPSRTTRRLAVAVVLIVVLGLAAATAASLIVARANAGEHQEALEAQGGAITTSFEQRIDLAVRVLRTTRGLLRVDPTPTNLRFQEFLRSATNTSTGADGALRFDGFGGITFIRWVRAADAEAFIARKRLEGFGDTFDEVPTDEDSYVFTLHSSADSEILGVDVRPVATRREALHHARDSGEPAVTEWVVPLSAQGIDPARADQAVAVYLPVYRSGEVPDTVAERRAELVGWMNTGVRASDLFDHAIPERGGAYDVALYDGEPSPQTLVRSTTANGPQPGALSVQTRIAIGEHTWTLVVSGQQQLSTPLATTRNPAVVFGLVMLLSALTAVLVAVLGRQRRRIQQQVIGITAQLRHSEQRLRRMADAVPVGIFDVDQQSGETFVNQRFRDLTGGDWTAWAQAHPQLQRDIVDAVESDHVFTKRIDIADSSGSAAWLEVTVTGERDDDGNVTRLLGSVVDVTADVTIEARLSEARDAALANARMKSEFLANMSHEIRTPLNGVIGLATLMLDDDLSQTQKERLVTLREAGQDLLVLLNDILDFSKLEAGRLHLENAPFSLGTVIEQVVALYASTANDKALTVRSSVDPAIGPVTGDPARLRQVLQNLVGNALKFTERGGVEIAAELVEQDGQNRVVRIAVSDTGIGISPEAQRRIFQVFYQADTSTTRLYGGSGLGLAICQQILDLMGATLEVESTLGKGSTFAFTVRLGVTTDVAEIAPPTSVTVADPAVREGKSWSGATMLVVEDNQVNRQVALGMVAKLGYSAEAAVDGIEALDALRRARYDLVLMDCQMPRLDGYETTAHIRAMEGEVRHTPIIAMTASAMVGDRERCIAAGMDDYVSKPIDIDKLSDAIHRALSTRHGADDQPAQPATAPDNPPAEPVQDAGADQPAPNDIASSLDPAAVQLLEQLPSDDGSVFENVSTIFLRTSAAEMNDAKAAAGAQEWDRLAYIVHQLGGAASIIGATSLTNRCHDLKICIEEQLSPQRILSALADVEVEVDRVHDVLTEQVPDAASTSGTKHPAG